MSTDLLPASNSLQEEPEARSLDAIFLSTRRKARNYCASHQRIEWNWYEFRPQIFLGIEDGALARYKEIVTQDGKAQHF